MYLCRKHVQASYPQLGKDFGKDHSTVLSACRKIKNAMAVMPNWLRYSHPREQNRCAITPGRAALSPTTRKNRDCPSERTIENQQQHRYKTATGVNEHVDALLVGNRCHLFDHGVYPRDILAHPNEASDPRIISLSPSNTELLYAIGAGDLLVDGQAIVTIHQPQKRSLQWVAFSHPTLNGF